MRFFLIGYHFKEYFVEFVSIIWKLEYLLPLSNTLNTTKYIFHWKSVAFLFLLSSKKGQSLENDVSGLFQR